MESLGEIVYRLDKGHAKSRSTIYRGIRMRSKLEVRFARYLDSQGEEWRYEPAIYGPRGEGYLPDFQIVGSRWPTFVEVKPTQAEAQVAMRRMPIIWETWPEAILLVAVGQGSTFYAAKRLMGWAPIDGRWAE